MGFTYLQPVNYVSSQYNNNFTVTSSYGNDYINSVHNINSTNPVSDTYSSINADAETKTSSIFSGSYYDAGYILSILKSQSINSEYGYSDLLQKLYETSPDDPNYNEILSLLNFPLSMQEFNSYLSTPSSIRWMQRHGDQNFNTTTDLSSLKDVYNPELSNKFANIAYQNALATNTRGWCARGVMDAAEKSGIVGKGETRVASAYQADPILENNKNFEKVGVSRDNILNLPAGCILVFQNSEQHVHGHITVTLGNNKAASDHIEDLKRILETHPEEVTVFVPVENKKSGKK